MLRRDMNPLILIALLLSLILLGFLIRTLHVAYLFPIYPDEIAERILLSRFWFDFPIKFDLLPMCKKASYRYPVVWYFPGLVEWLWHSQTANLKIFRIIGVGTSCLFFLSVVYKLCQRNINFFAHFYKKIIFFMLALGLVASLLYIGVVPFFLVTVRPEQIILLFLSLLLILFAMRPATSSERNVLILIYFISVSMLLYQHPKTFFLLPVLLVIAYRLFAHCNKYVVVSLFLALIFLVIANYAAWKQVYDCSNSPPVDKFFATFNLNFKNITHDTPAFFSEVWQSFLDYESEIHSISFQTISEINYIPSIGMNHGLVFFNNFIYMNYIIIFGVVLISSLVLYVFDVLKKNVLTPNLLTIVLFLCSFSNLIINRCKHWYDAGYLWCLLVLTAIFYVSNYVPNLSKRRVTYVALIYFLLVGIVSQFYFVKKYAPPLKDGYTGPGVSIATYHHDIIQKELMNATLLCHIDRKSSKNLILDDETYLYFQQSRYPLAFTYLQFIPDPNFLHGFLNKFDIDGLVVRSLYLPHDMQEKYATKIGEFVCVEKSNIRPLFEEMIALSDKQMRTDL